MPLSVKDLINEIRNVPVQVGSLTLTVRYSPYWLTLAKEDQLAQLEAGTIETATLFCGMVSGWDLVDDGGEEVPITLEAIKANNVPVRILKEAVEAIWADMLPGKPSSNGSSPGSESDAVADPPQAGTT